MNSLFEYIRRSVLVFLAVLVFGTSSCFAMNVHICKGEVQSVAFFGNAAPCENMQEKKTDGLAECCKARLKKVNERTHFSQKPCCSNTSVIAKSLQNADETAASNVEIASTDIILSPFALPNFTLFSVILNEAPYFFPPPPDIDRDVLTLHQVRII